MFFASAFLQKKYIWIFHQTAENFKLCAYLIFNLNSFYEQKIYSGMFYQYYKFVISALDFFFFFQLGNSRWEIARYFSVNTISLIFLKSKAQSQFGFFSQRHLNLNFFPLNYFSSSFNRKDQSSSNINLYPYILMLLS